MAQAVFEAHRRSCVLSMQLHRDVVHFSLITSSPSYDPIASNKDGNVQRLRGPHVLAGGHAKVRGRNSHEVCSECDC
jgi:hypothetical protein